MNSTTTLSAQNRANERKDTPLLTTTLAAEIERIRGGLLKELTAHVRTLDGDAQRDYKARNVPAFTPAGTFAPTRSKDNLDRHSGMIVLDLDDLADPDRMVDQLSGYADVAAAYVSVGGQGVKAIIAVDPIPCDAAEHTAAWTALADAYSRRLDLPIEGSTGRAHIDESGSDVSRLSFVAHDPMAYLAPDVSPFRLDGLAAPPERREYTAPPLAAPERYERALWAIPANTPGYARWLKTAASAKAAGLSSAEVERWAQGADPEQGRRSKLAAWAAFWDGLNLDQISGGSLFHLADEISPGWRLDTPSPARLATPDDPQRGFDWGFVDLASLASLPPPEYAVPGIAVLGSVSILFAKSGDGKTTLIYAMLKAMTPSGPDFLGVHLDTCPVLMFSEEPDTLMGQRVRDNGIPLGYHMVNTASALAKDPAAFANDVYTEFHRHGGGFGMVLIDTLTSFANVQETNSYSEVGNAMRQMKTLAKQLNASVLLLHHRGKQGAEGNDGAIGSISFVAQSDQRLALNVRNDQRLLTVSGKYPTAPFAETVAFTVNDGRAEIVATRADLEGDAILVALDGAPTPMNVKAIMAKMTDPPGKRTVQSRIDDLLKTGDIEQVEPARGNIGATYRRADYTC